MAGLRLDQRTTTSVVDQQGLTFTAARKFRQLQRRTGPGQPKGIGEHGSTSRRGKATPQRRQPQRTPKGLTARQKKILETIQRSVNDNGYPPSMREIGDTVGLASLSSVTHQLSQLEKLGYLRRDPKRPRAMEVLMPLTLDGGTGKNGASAKPAVLHSVGGTVTELPTAMDTAMVPLVGRIAAGGPILADQVVEDVMPLPRQLVGQGELFMLRVAGDSMVDAAICDGDWVVVRRQATPPTATSLRPCWTTKPPSRPSASATATRGCCPRTPSTSPSLVITPRSWGRSSRSCGRCRTSLPWPLAAGGRHGRRPPSGALPGQPFQCRKCRLAVRGGPERRERSAKEPGVTLRGKT